MLEKTTSSAGVGPEATTSSMTTSAASSTTATSTTTMVPTKYPSTNRGSNNEKKSKIQQGILKLPKEIRNIAAGGFAGMVAKSVVAPFDRIKILYQISSAEFHIYRIPRVAANIIKTEGWTALWKGNTATMIRVFPYSGIQFMVYDRCKTWLLREQELDYVRRKTNNPKTKRPHWGLSPTQSLVSGMIAGAVSVCATYPLDLTRTQLAVLKRKCDPTKNLGFFHILSNNFKSRGFVGLFRGISPTLMGILPYSGIAFAFNEQGKRKIQLMKGSDLSNFERMQCGAISGLFAQSLTYPLEVTRRRMQTIGIVATSGNEAAVSALGPKSPQQQSKAIAAAEAAIRKVAPTKPPSMLSIVKELYEEQGHRGFFKGVSLNWFKGPIAFSISFTAFDIFQGILETETERKAKLPKRRTTAEMAEDAFDCDDE